MPYVLRVRDGSRLTAQPHPDVDGLRKSAEVTSCRLPQVVDSVGPHSDVVLRGRLPRARSRLGLAIRHEDTDIISFALERSGDRVVITGPGVPLHAMPLGVTADGGFELRVLLDACLVEVFTAAGTASAVRTSPLARAGNITMTPAGDEVGWRR